MKRFALALALAALALAAPTLAQDAAGGTVGIGVSISPLESSGYTAPTVEVYVPIKIAPQLRLEPSVGIVTSDRDNRGGELVDTSDVTLGLGVFFVQRVAAPVDFYAGGRFKLNFASVDNGFDENNGTDVVIAGALGGEYYFVPKFSLGLEAQLGYYSRSDASFDEADGFFTSGLAFLRMYF